MISAKQAAQTANTHSPSQIIRQLEPLIERAAIGGKYFLITDLQVSESDQNILERLGYSVSRPVVIPVPNIPQFLIAW